MLSTLTSQMMKNNLIIILLLFVSKVVTSQIDMHSQYYWNELQLNPALTGLIEPKWRIKDVRRYEFDDGNQKINNSLYADLKIMFNKKTGDYGLVMSEFTGYMMGIGIMDQRLKSDLETDTYRADYFSLSFHKLIKGNSYISLGIQPGYLRMNEMRKFDLNAGVMFGNKQVTCWTEDQYFKTQIGVAVYNILSDYHPNDSLYSPGKRIQVHGGYLIEEPEHFDILASAALWYDQNVHVSVGANVLFFPIVHYRFFDRGRLGLHYRTSNHLVFSGGFRLYGRGQKTISLDMQLSYDMPMGFLDLVPAYKHGFEFGIVLMPLRKCWSLSKC